MRRKERVDTPSQTSRARFQTPDKAATTAPSSTNTLRHSQEPAAPKKLQTPAVPSHARLNPSRERGYTFESVNQPTLTQIDWAAIKRQEPDLDDAGLDYIDTAADGARDDAPSDNARHEVIEIPDGSEGDVDYCPAPSSRTRLPRGPDTKKRRTTSEQRKSSATPKNASAGKKRRQRKSGMGASNDKKANKQPTREGDKTLTQIGYVRRYLKIEPDDDVKLEYTYYSPEKDKDPESREAHIRSAQEAVEPTKHEPVELSAHKRRKLSELDPEVSPKREGTHSIDQFPQICVTPKKSVKAEIPSSQSPESPGFAMISPSKFRGMNRLSLEQKPPDADDRPIKEEPFGISQKEERSYDAPSQNDAVLEPPLPPSSPLQHNASTSSAPKKTPTTRNEGTRYIKPENVPSSTQRTVVYETDAESDGSDFQDHASQVSAEDQPNDNDDDDNFIEGSQHSPHDKSQELPPPVIASDRDNESEQRFIEATLSSDASICYGRPQQSTQFPLEPIPPLNTQKMTELFPSYKESNDQQIMTDTTQTQSSPAVQRRSLPIYPQHTQTQTQTQSQSQPQPNSMDKKSTDIVPESSPVARQDDGVDSNASMPHDSCGQESVVQVESSQPPDKLLMNFRMDHDSGPRGFISGNQLLSSSVMESIPMPQLWMGSQDSVGEPYSEPDRE